MICAVKPVNAFARAVEAVLEEAHLDGAVARCAAAAESDRQPSSVSYAARATGDLRLNMTRGVPSSKAMRLACRSYSSRHADALVGVRREACRAGPPSGRRPPWRATRNGGENARFVMMGDHGQSLLSCFGHTAKLELCQLAPPWFVCNVPDFRQRRKINAKGLRHFLESHAEYARHRGCVEIWLSVVNTCFLGCPIEMVVEKLLCQRRIHGDSCRFQYGLRLFQCAVPIYEAVFLHSDDFPKRAIV